MAGSLPKPASFQADDYERADPMAPATPSGSNNGGRVVRSLVVKALCVIGGALLLRRLTKSTTRWDHAKTVAQALSGEKVC